MPAKTVEPERMRAQNSGLLLNLIWQERSVSRAELARRTGLSKAMIGELIGELVSTELVRDSGASDSAAGKTSMLSFRDDAFVIVGIELAVDWVHVVVTDLRGHVRTMRH